MNMPSVESGGEVDRISRVEFRLGERRMARYAARTAEETERAEALMARFWSRWAQRVGYDVSAVSTHFYRTLDAWEPRLLSQARWRPAGICTVIEIWEEARR